MKTNSLKTIGERTNNNHNNYKLKRFSKGPDKRSAEYIFMKTNENILDETRDIRKLLQQQEQLQQQKYRDT